jgi:hypothetical protein
MYNRNQWCEDLQQKIKDKDADEELKGKYKIILQVELALRLIEQLRLFDEPITVIWGILSATPIRDNRVLGFTAQQRHMIANARILLPFSGRTNWEHALGDYAAIPDQWRCYTVRAENLDQQFVLCPNPQNFQERLDLYDRTLKEPLQPLRRSTKPVIPGSFAFDAYLSSKKEVAQIEITQDIADLTQLSVPWFSALTRSRGPFQISYAELLEAAQELDDRETKIFAKKSGKTWLELAQDLIAYRALQPDGSLSDSNQIPLEIDGQANVVGSVGSGKTTLAKFILTRAIIHPELDQRITLVVADVMTAMDLADYFNRLFCQPTAPPVAVPLLGRSTRNKHLGSLYNSKKSFREDHWALQWLNTACPLQAVSTSLAEPITPGKEPCDSLYEQKYITQPERRKYFFCPFFAVCPSKQLYRDLPMARIWITTPGSLSHSTVPVQLDQQAIPIYKLVYDQSDLVIFDEVDLVQNWFDNQFASETKLTNGKDALLDIEDVETARAWIAARAQKASSQRWVNSERHTLSAVSNILSNLTDRARGVLLRNWIRRNFFTALNLAYKLCWRFLGLPVEDDILEGTQALKLSKSKIRQLNRLLSRFDQLHDQDSLAMLPPSQQPFQNPIYRLALITRDILAGGDSTHNQAVHQACKDWIMEFVPSIENTLARLAQPPSPPQKGDFIPQDTLDTLAIRLEFTLSVMLLDRNIRIVFYEWYNKPDTVVTELNEFSLERSPGSLLDILPLPPTGRRFGTYYAQNLPIGQDTQASRKSPETNTLSVFAYPNIGRVFITRFHELFRDIEEKDGPNTLLLSGTSWLPHSSRWHVNVPLHGILDPSPTTQNAIALSTFEYIPQIGRDGNPIRISGPSEKLEPVQQLMEMLGSLLQRELASLQNLSQTNPIYWEDRERILLLLNSYDQCEWAFDRLRDTWIGDKSLLIPLIRPDEQDTDGISRSDIEDFASTGKKILIAPMQAIGRGYNILNSKGNAAFGAIYFLTRPMPAPADTQVLAAEMNRLTLEWFKDTSLPVWNRPGLYEKFLDLRRDATDRWRKAERRRFYRQLDHDKEQPQYSERYDLTATTAGYVIQACGRLLRGGVPFHAYFVDAAWAPLYAKQPLGFKETPKTSMLAGMMEILSLYVQDPIGEALFGAIVQALRNIQGFNPEY